MRRLSPFLTLWLAACGRASARDCEATVDEAVRTRLHVTWDAPEGGTSWVEFSPDGRAALIAPAIAEDPRHAVLVGAGPLEDVDWTAITEIDGRRWTCSGTLSTGNSDAGIPAIEATTFDAEALSPERFLLGSLQDGDHAIVFLVDREGRLAWWQASDRDRAVVDVEPLGGADIAWNSFDVTFQKDAGELRFASILGGPIETLRTPLAHHTFEVTPDGFAWMALDVRDVADPETGEIVKLGGDSIVLRDHDGAERTLWTSWDTFPDLEPPEGPDGFYGDVVDLLHGNGLTYDADRDAFLYSTYRAITVVQVDAGSGAVVESYGALGDHTFEPPGLFFGQHDPSFTPEGRLLVFTQEIVSDLTEAAEFEILPETQKIRRGWQSGVGHGLNAEWLGQATRLDNGNTLVGQGSAGVLHEVAPDGTIVWELRLGIGATLGMVTLVDDPQDMRPTAP